MPRAVKIAGLVLVTFLLFLLVGLALQCLRAVTATRVAKTSSYLWVFETGSTSYFSMFKEWPRSIRDFTQNPSNILFIPLSQPANDAWGRPIIYEPFDATRGYGRVLSYGRDGKLGGDGPDADLERRFGP